MSRQPTDPYQAIAPRYDTFIEPLNRKLKRFALRYAPPEPGAVVLDVGCGTGTLLELYRAAGCELWGIDGSAAMLAQARKRLGHQAHLHEADATAMPYPEGRFDWVVFTFVLHEMAVETRLGVLAEAKRVLHPEGRILVVDYHGGPLRFPRGWLTKGLVTAIERAAGGAHWAGYRHFMAHGAMDGLAPEAGLAIERQRVVGWGNFAISVLHPQGAS
jgi:ubiquinone/menaquinone biosynthesis C-methylase UbiE